MKNKYFYFLALIFPFVNSCIGGGTHGYIKAYQYDTSKKALENAVNQVVKNNIAIHQDSTKDYYNDGTKYMTINIVYENLPYNYTFRYYGGKEYWDTSKISEIFIAYAYDEERNGGSSGNGGINWYDFKLKKRLTAPFEQELVYKIDSILGMKHTEE